MKLGGSNFNRQVGKSHKNGEALLAHAAGGSLYLLALVRAIGQV